MKLISRCRFILSCFFVFFLEKSRSSSFTYAGLPIRASCSDDEVFITSTPLPWSSESIFDLQMCIQLSNRVTSCSPKGYSKLMVDLTCPNIKLTSDSVIFPVNFQPNQKYCFDVETSEWVDPKGGNPLRDCQADFKYKFRAQSASVSSPADFNISTSFSAQTFTTVTENIVLEDNHEFHLLICKFANCKIVSLPNKPLDKVSYFTIINDQIPRGQPEWTAPITSNMFSVTRVKCTKPDCPQYSAVDTTRIGIEDAAEAQAEAKTRIARTKIELKIEDTAEAHDEAKTTIARTKIDFKIKDAAEAHDEAKTTIARTKIDFKINDAAEAQPEAKTMVSWDKVGYKIKDAAEAQAEAKTMVSWNKVGYKIKDAAEAQTEAKTMVSWDKVKYKIKDAAEAQAEAKTMVSWDKVEFKIKDAAEAQAEDKVTIAWDMTDFRIEDDLQRKSKTMVAWDEINFKIEGTTESKADSKTTIAWDIINFKIQLATEFQAKSKTWIVLDKIDFKIEDTVESQDEFKTMIALSKIEPKTEDAAQPKLTSRDKLRRRFRSVLKTESTNDLTTTTTTTTTSTPFDFVEFCPV